MMVLSKIQFAFILFLILVTPLTAYGVDGQIKIGQTASTSFPIQISQQGNYVLTSNITVLFQDTNCIEITVDNVTVDLNGFALIGGGGGGGYGGYGIYAVNSIKNITIMNGKVAGFARTGIEIYQSGPCRNILIKDISTYGNGVGFRVDNATMINCSASNNAQSGFSVRNSIITNCSACNNSNGSIGVGFYADYGSTITNCTAFFNGSDGIYAGTKNRIEGNNLRDNYGNGLNMGGSHNYAIKNSASGNLGSNFVNCCAGNNYMPTSLSSADAGNANVGW